MIAAREYAGEVEANPMDRELTNPIAPGFRVAAAASFWSRSVSTGVSWVLALPGGAPVKGSY